MGGGRRTPQQRIGASTLRRYTYGFRLAIAQADARPVYLHVSHTGLHPLRKPRRLLTQNVPVQNWFTICTSCLLRCISPSYIEPKLGRSQGEVIKRTTLYKLHQEYHELSSPTCGPQRIPVPSSGRRAARAVSLDHYDSVVAPNHSLSISRRTPGSFATYES